MMTQFEQKELTLLHDYLALLHISTSERHLILSLVRQITH